MGRIARRLSLAAAWHGHQTKPALGWQATAERNAASMLERAARMGCALRPHMKTHKTVEGALLQVRDHGAAAQRCSHATVHHARGSSVQTGGKRRRITVSTLAEAEFFVENAFDDILYAVPITGDKLPQVAPPAPVP